MLRHYLNKAEENFAFAELSLLEIPSEADIERPRIANEVIRLSETGSDLNHKRPTSDRD